MASIRECLANNLKALRKAKGLTQEALAEAVGVTGTSIAHIETKRTWPNPDTITSIAVALEVPEEALFRLTTKPSLVVASDRDFLRDILKALPSLDNDGLEAVFRVADRFAKTASANQKITSEIHKK